MTETAAPQMSAAAIIAYRPMVHSTGGRQPGVTERKVVNYAKAVAAWLSEFGTQPLMKQHIGDNEHVDNGPVVYGPGYHSDSWVIGYEGAYEWPWEFFNYLDDLRNNVGVERELTRAELTILRLTDGFYMEACNGWSGSIYPR